MRYSKPFVLLILFTNTFFFSNAQKIFDSVFNISKKNIVSNFHEAKNIQSNYKEYIFFPDSTLKIANYIELSCVIENQYGVIKDIYENINRKYYLISASKYDSLQTNSFTNPYQYSPIFQNGINGGNYFFNSTTSPINELEIKKSMENIASSKSSTSCRVSNFIFDTLTQKNNLVDTLYQNIPCLKIKYSYSINRRIDNQVENKDCIAEWAKQIEYSETTIIINKSDYAILKYTLQKTFLDSNNKKYYLLEESTFKKDNKKYYEESYVAIMPRYTYSACSCGFNERNLYSLIIKSNSPINNLTGLIKSQLIKPETYNNSYDGFCKKIDSIPIGSTGILNSYYNFYVQQYNLFQ